MAATETNKIISWWFSAVTLNGSSEDTEFLAPACRNGALTAEIRTNLHLEGNKTATLYKNKICRESDMIVTTY